MEHYKLELMSRGQRVSVSVGDSVLLCSGDYQEEPATPPPSRGKLDDDAELAMFDADDSDEDDDDLYNAGESSSSSRPSHSDPARGNYSLTDEGYLDNDDEIRALDPFVAQIERMWEEPAPTSSKHSSHGRRKKSGTDLSATKTLQNDFVSDDAQRKRMKIRARWYFKKADLEGIDGKFVGLSKSQLLSSMTSKDLVLGDCKDDNEISTLLGKCHVLRRKPRRDGSKESIPRAFICRYEININAGAVILKPHEGKDQKIPVPENKNKKSPAFVESSKRPSLVKK
eukprot:scaffold29472_cov53-Attheya_sp.AAC.6